MNKLDKAIHDIHRTDTKDSARTGNPLLHPLSSLIVTFVYILTVVSFDKYNLDGLTSMVLYLLVTGIWNGISIKNTISRIWPVLLLVSMVGIANPFLDRRIYLQTENLVITTGIISMLTLMLKGIFCVLASYFLLIEIGMEGICCSLRCLHVPKEFVTMLLLIYRYLILLMKEVERMMQAYKLRAPGQKGLHVKTWGTFVGQLLLRSISRAETVYESMLLRGYQGEFGGKHFTWKMGSSICYAFLWITVLIGLRAVPVFSIVGTLLQ